MLRPETKPISVSLVAWFCIAFFLGLTGRFENASPAVVGLTVWGLTALGLLIVWKVPQARDWATNVDLRWIIALHLVRFVGIYFVILCRSGELSCAFAKPAGTGDVLTAAAACLLLLTRAVQRGWRKTILAWNCFGLIDIVSVVFSAFRVGLTDWVGMAPLRALPLMLLPTFVVPLIISSHVIIFVRTRR